MSCDIKFDNPIVKSLRRLVGTNDTLLCAYLSEVLVSTKIDGNIEWRFNNDFAKEVKEKFNCDADNIPKNKVAKVAKYVKEYYNRNNPDTNATTKLVELRDKSTVYGYQSVADRDFCKQQAVSFANDIYNQIIRKKNTTIKEYLKEEGYDKEQYPKRAFFADAIEAKIVNIIVKKVLDKRSDLTEDDVYDIIDSGDILALENIFGEEASVQDKNILAFYKEVVSNREEFFSEIFKNSNLGSIRFEDTNVSEDSSYDAIEDQDDTAEGESSGEEPNNNSDNDKNNTIRQLNEKLGDFTTYMTHVDETIKVYFNSLPKLNSTIIENENTPEEKYDYDLNNPLGIVTTMNANQCCGIIYSYGDFTNTSTMIRSIEQISKRLPGYSAFIKVAKDLKANPSLAYQFYCTFAKFIAAKLETVVDNDTSISRISNKTFDKLTSLKFEYINSLKHTAIEVSNLNSKEIEDVLTKQINTIKDVIDKNKTDKIDKYTTLLTAELVRHLKKYYPTIDEFSIANYIKNARNGDIVANAEILKSILIQTINSSASTLYNYNNKQDAIYRANKKLASNRFRRNQGEEVPESENPNLDELYRQEYIDKSSQSAAINLAKELVNFTPVKTELNSRNVHGNQSSDVLNNNMISNLINSLKSELALGNYGKLKFQTKQYDFSNILVEHTYKDGPNKGKTINYGLFKQNPDTGEYIPTSYAHRLLKARLFSGATDVITSSNALYAEMSKNDYIATSFINFFNTEETFDEEGVSIDFANYFMRIPSDAPKNFIISAPKYSVKETSSGLNNGLFYIKDEAKANELIRDEINNIPTTEYISFNGMEISDSKVISHLTSKKIGDFTIDTRKIEEKNAKVGDTIHIVMKYIVNGTEMSYLLEGTLAKNNDNKNIIKAPKLVGVINGTFTADIVKALRDKIRKRLINNKEIELKVNTEHQIYKQFRQIFVQEIQDMATAIGTFFELNSDGSVKFDDKTKTPIFKKNFKNDKETARRLLQIYHVGKDKTILESVNGLWELTGSVFKSDRFTIGDKNYGQEILNEAFNLLYGGGDSHIHIVPNGEAYDVNITATQENAIAKHLESFILDYVNDTKNRIEEFKEFIPENLYTEDNITEFALNYHLAYVGFNDLFEGDTKFYKDNQTFLKRAKEVQGSGVPYGMTDYNIDLTSTDRNLIFGPLNDVIGETFKPKVFTRAIVDDKTGKTTTEKIEIGQYDKFRGVTIKNTVRTSKEVQVKGVNGAKEDGIVVTQLAKSLELQGMKKDEALEAARDLMAGKQRDGKHGFSNTTVNDAQSYITFEEWVRRIAGRGQLPKYMPLIEKILDETKPIDISTITEFVQVQKNFYYDQHYYKELGVIAPRQIKNAEFVLVPRFIKGTQLEKVYKLMKDNGIDQLNTEETSKAGKCNVLTLWDNDGNITEQNIKDFNNNAAGAVELYYYNNLYTQQETPQHINAENKAGIQIMKKIVDNIDKDSPLYQYKEKFFSLYSSNIKESFYDLIDELNIEIDENGNIVKDEDGNIKGLNVELFFKRLQEEVARLGLDSNMLDYVILEKDQLVNKVVGDQIFALTKMPTYMSNVSGKLENIAQSLFNSRITRQKLPGFHAAQITNVGFKSLNESIENRAYSKELRYHPEQYKNKKTGKTISWRQHELLNDDDKKNYENIGAAPYIEVLLPASNFNFKRENEDGTKKTDKQLLEELQEAGLDTVIGYRIPTEGKQSVCVMKVVGFVNDAQGSTIVVPDDWVAQTGSDFDIDSVYGINYTSYVDKKTGKIKKIKYKNANDENDYINYIKHRLNHKKENKEFAEAAEKANEYSSQWDSLMDKESSAYHDLPEEIRNKIKEIQEASKQIDESKEKNKHQKYVNQNNAVINGLKSYIKNNNLTDELKAEVENYISIKEDINTELKGITIFENIAKQSGLPTFEEYQNLDETVRNTRDARNNEILDCMITILSHPLSLEENLSRSNFEDIIDARDACIDKEVQNARKHRSAYNILDQAEYQEDAMSGAKLKAFSVTRDTFCSICNTVKPYLDNKKTIKIVYDSKDGYTLKELQKSFEKVIDNGNGTFTVEHNTLGWSKNNKNVVGKIITAYSSQTTAHILDAIKEGPIPNVNDYTFQVYKLFPDIGSDYNTAVAFIMQSGVTRIVKAYNANKSIYSRDSYNPIHKAIKSVAKELFELTGETYNEYESIGDTLEKLQKFNKQLASLFNVDGNFEISLEDKDTGKLLINGNDLKDNLKHQGKFENSSPVEKLLFDLGVILQYNKLSNLANTISDYARVCNPDKFGAKQSIFETNKVFDDIHDIITDDNKRNVLSVNRIKDDKIESISLIESIYPGVNQFGSSDDRLDKYISSKETNSAYPPLHNFLKYATATSIKINRGLFETQRPQFRREIERIEDLFSHGKRLDEKTYKDFQNYTLNYLYSQTSAVSQHVTYDVKNDCFVISSDTDSEKERARIYGYDKSSDFKVPVYKEEVTENGTKYVETGDTIDFEVQDINHPTELEINQFSTLSPAQKVAWMQGHFRESGIFKYLRVSLFNSGKRANKAGMQTISYIENNENIETIYNEFEKCYYNSNPLVALSAFDLVKYGFAVEGFRMRRNAVNKVIANSVLYRDQENGGTGIVQELNGKIAKLGTDFVEMNVIRENFIRSNPNIKQINTKKVDKINKAFELKIQSDGSIYIDSVDLMKKYDIIYEIDKKNNAIYPNKFIRLRFGKNTTLYKVHSVSYNQAVVLQPVNVLENNENAEWSANPANWKYANNTYYMHVIEQYDNTVDENIANTYEEIIAKNRDLYKETTKVPVASKVHKEALPFDINDKKSIHVGAFENAIDKITEHFSKNPVTPLYIRNIALPHYIKYTGPTNASKQEINGRLYRISKISTDSINKNYIIKGKKVKETNESLTKIIEEAQKDNLTFNDLFLVEPAFDIDITTIEENSDASTNEFASEMDEVNKFGTSSIRTMQKMAFTEKDKDAASSINRLREKNIMATNASVEENLAEVINVTAKYVDSAVNNIMKNITYFAKDEEGNYFAINDQKAIDLIRNNPVERQRFLKTILDARAFVKNYRLINEIDLDSTDPEIRRNLVKIKENINRLQNTAIINSAEELFATDFLKKLSDNPLIQGDVLSVLDGYHSATAFDAWVNDLQETSNPLLQIVTKEVMSDIRSKEMLAHKRVAEFRKNIARIKDEARKAGVTIDWKHIIDNNGKFIQDYKQSFIDRMNELRDNVNSAKITFGEGSLEYLDAKFAYDKWKLNHLNQRLIDDYYFERLEIEEHMLGNGTDENRGFRTIYAKYKELEARRRDICSFIDSKNSLEDSKLEELKEIDKQIKSLTSNNYYDATVNEFVPKKSNSDPSNTLTGEARKLYSLESATALNGYLASMSKLRETYFAHDAKYGFEEELEHNLEIISIKENRDEFGRPQKTQYELMQDAEYVRAKNWVLHNTRFVVDSSVKKLVDGAFKTLKESKEGRSRLRDIAVAKNAYDEKGNINATLFDDNDIYEIREEQRRNYNLRESEPFNSRSLISSAPTDDTVFKTEFYQGMKPDGIPNEEYVAIVKEINAITEKYYDNRSKTLELHRATEEELEKLNELYEKIEPIKKTKNSSNGKAIFAYISENVEFITDEIKYETEKEFARQAAVTKGKHWYSLWENLNERIVEKADGSIAVEPNRLIYGYAVPKGYKSDGTGNNDLVNKKKTEALRIINSYCTTVPTEYYFEKYREMRAKSDKEFNEWYAKNHIYNPYTHTRVPISCWTTLEINDISDDGTYKSAGTYVPAFNQEEYRPRNGKDKNGKPNGTPNFVNEKYKEGPNAINYKAEGINLSKTGYEYDDKVRTNKFKDSENYDNTNVMNNYERQIKEEFEAVLRANATTTSAKKYIEKGYLPSRYKAQEVNAKFIAKQAATLVGWIDAHSGNNDWLADNEVDYSTDQVIDMPMMTLLKTKESINIDIPKPKRKEDESLEDFNKRVSEYEAKIKEARKVNERIHAEQLDNNWENVMEDFILQSAHFNAIQDNKYMLFYAKNMLDKLDVYVKHFGNNTLQRSGLRSSRNEYVTKKDKNLQEQYINWVRRLVYDQWKKPEKGFTRAADIAQSLISAKFMMLNLTGGIANITVGKVNILGEALAKEYIGFDSWRKGMGFWTKNLPNFLADMYKDKSSSLGSAIVKFMNIVDFDEQSGSVHVHNASKFIKRFRDLQFSQQAIGEHMMQNSVMFAMMESHRLVKNPNKDENGKTSYVLMNEAEYMANASSNALNTILNKSENVQLREKYEEFKKYETSNPNRLKDYVWFKDDLVTKFVNIYLNNEQKEEFNKLRRENQDAVKKEFNNDEQHPTLMSQLKLSEDGTLDFKDGSIMLELGDEAYKILGTFKGRVISVNKKIHGIYDRLGAAKLESLCCGSLIMQYHKHIYPGIMKRWRRKGYFNEERGTIEKGSYISLMDFLALPLKDKKFVNKLKNNNNMSESNLLATEGIQNLFKSYLDFFLHIKLNYKTLPEYERANIRRAMSDIIGVLAALCLTVAVKCMVDDDEDGLVYNLAIHEFDRLASEVGMYNPFGLYSEAKKLWSSPVAVTGSISDAIHSMGFIAQYIIQGDEFDPYYQSGIYAGESKLTAMIKRNIPMYHSYNMLVNLQRNNSYYKLGDNMLTFIPVNSIVDWIKH